ncbi:MAG: tape measure protein [Butyricicoccus sp.]
MAESFSVKAILSAQDKSFSSGMKAAGASLKNLKSTITSGLGFGLLTGAGQAAFHSISSGVTGIISDMNEASATWKTFQGNMEMNGKSEKQIAKTQKSLQKFAQQTIYSSSDMASTYAQLDAVGTKHTTKLVKGFGGLAAAAENPSQAMKTLSQQATQMAAKPTVQWQDFKLMLEQTPAGIAAVAKSMGKSTQQLIKDVQDGTIATEDFFDAVAKTGTNKAFTKLATQYKTVGQAADGLKETISNTLQPAFSELSTVGIAAISGIANKIEGIDGKALAKKVQGMIQSASKYWDVLKEDAVKVGSAFSDAFSAIGDSLSELTGSGDGLKTFSSVLGGVTDALVAFAGFMEDHADAIAAVLPKLPLLLAGYKGFKILKSVSPLVGVFSGSLLKLASGGIGKIAGKLFGIGKGADAVGKSGKASAKQISTAAASFVKMGAGVLLVSAGFALLAFSAIRLADAGPGAVAVMFGLVAAVGALSVGLMAAMKYFSQTPAKATAMSTVMLSLGTMVLMVSAGFYILSQAAVQLAAAGAPAVATMLGLVAAVGALMVVASVVGQGLTAGAVGLLAFGAAVLIAGAGMMVLSNAAINLAAAGTPAIACMVGMVAAIALLAAGAAALGPALLLGAAGVVVLGAGLLIIATAAVVAGAGLNLVAAALPTVAQYGLTSATAITALGAALLVFAAGGAAAGAVMVVFGAGLVTASAGAIVLAAALVGINTSMKSIASNAKSAESSLLSMESSVDAVGSGLDALGSVVKSSMDSIVSAFDSTAGRAQSSGQKIGRDFTTGLRGQLSVAVSVSRTMSLQVANALRAAGASAYSSGAYIGIGFANGMRSQLGNVRSVAAQLAAAADEAVRAKAKISSPSRVFEQLGIYIGQGFANGIASMEHLVRMASMDMVYIPAIASGSNLPAGGYNGGLSDEYDYYGNAQYTIIVPLEVDGREFARATATYTQAELDRQQSREKRKSGRTS